MKNIYKFLLLFVVTVFYTGCQNVDRPVLGNYPIDANPAGGPLKFYVAFNGTTSDVLMNAVDSIRANFATANTTTAIDGISGKGIQGGVGKFVTYAKPNDFATYAKSFTISFWEKHNGQTKNNALTNGPEYPFSFVAPGDYHWSSSNFFLLFEGDNTACAVKFVLVSGVNASGASVADTWLTWEGANALPGLLDDKWHHCVFVYDEKTSGLTFYLDNKVIGTKTWDGHGALGLVNDKISSVRIGCGPQGDANDVSDNWLASTWKGGLDQFRFYATALSAADVSALYTAKK